MPDKHNLTEEPSENGLDEEITMTPEDEGGKDFGSAHEGSAEKPAEDTSGSSNGKAVRKYTKEQLCSSKTYQGQRDLLNALLEDGKQYTKSQVNKLVKAYLSKEVD